MRIDFKNVLVLVISLLLFLPISSNASWSDLEWRIQEGDTIHYTYRGWVKYLEDVNDTFMEVTGILHEEVYFVVEDLWGTPIPSVAGPSMTVSPYWANGTPFGDDDDESITGWIAGSIDQIYQIAVRVGNWTLYTEQAEVIWTSMEPGSFVVSINETSEVWNITISTYIFENYLDRIFSYSYSKFDGVLNYSNFTFYRGSEDEPTFSIALSRIMSSPILHYQLVIGIAAIAAITVVLIILVKRRR